MRANTRTADRARDERGAALIVMIITVVVAGVMALALTSVTAGRQRATDTRMKMEAALAVADAGLHRSLAEANQPVNKGSVTPWPPTAVVADGSKPMIPMTLEDQADFPYYDPAYYSTEPYRIDGTTDRRGKVYDGFLLEKEATAPYASVTPSIQWNETGQFFAIFLRGDTDGIDNDGDGLLDAADLNDDGLPDEEDYVFVRVTGYLGKITKDASGELNDVNPYNATVEGQVKKITTQFDVKSSVFLQDPTPSINLGTSSAWLVSGKDWDMNDPNSLDPAGTALPGIATNGDFAATDEAELSAAGVDPPGPSDPQLEGTTPPWQESVPQSYDMAAIVEWAKTNAPPQNIVTCANGAVSPGGPYGIPPNKPGGPDWQITYTDVGGPGNEVKYGGGATDGAGIWVINGDANFDGNFNFTGLIICTGRIYYRGGGNRTFLGAIVGGSSGSLDSADISGVASIKYSSSAITNASNALATYSMGNWKSTQSTQ